MQTHHMVRHTSVCNKNTTDELHSICEAQLCWCPMQRSSQLKTMSCCSSLSRKFEGFPLSTPYEQTMVQKQLFGGN